MTTLTVLLLGNNDLWYGLYSQRFGRTSCFYLLSKAIRLTNKRFLNCLHLFIHLAVCLTTGPKPLPKWALHIVRSRASSFKWEYPLLSLRSSCSLLRLLPRPPVTSIPPFIFPSITRCKRQFVRKIWPISTAYGGTKICLMKMGVLKFCVQTKCRKAFQFTLSDKIYVELKLNKNQVDAPLF
jgi:hypothetical protein